MSKDRRFRWFVVAALFTATGLGLLMLFVDVFRWRYGWATLVQAEICTMLRFFVTDWWVFERDRPTWTRLGQYHVANALGFALWWGAANALKSIGVHYLLASLIAMLTGVAVSWLTNFRWIWRKHPQPAASREPAAQGGIN